MTIAIPLEVSPESSYHEICTALDDLLLEYMSLLESYNQKAAELGKSFANGYLSLAETKKSLGPGRISALQYDHRMTAFVGVDVEALPDHHKYSAQTLPTTTATSSPESTDSDLPKESTVRLRKNVVKNAENRVSAISENEQGSPVNEEIEGDETKADVEPPKPVDPIRWFSCLPPQSLRNAKAEFQSGLPLIMELANMQSRMKAIDQVWAELMRMKRGKEDVDVTDVRIGE
ncbi:hypothetical protein BKA69DRAFT_67957 [Paraphysoderma sedebokerense]|nr:hypothetical protein BKA69DRAFT_67957 [Paraphysoderma sedebokerense]